jgi:hypothetical protein
MLIRDSAQAVAREKTREGFLRVRARIGRVGIHDYKARELGAPPDLAPEAVVRVYRPPDAVFDKASMASFADVPVTRDHPPAMVDAANWKRYAVGHTGPSVVRDGDHLATDLVITDAEAVARAESGAELSNGYWADFVFGHGLTPQGEPYDAIQQNIRGNHIALVDHGRCGPTCRIDPAAPPSKPGPDPSRPAEEAGRDAAHDGAGPSCNCTPSPTGEASMSEISLVTIDGIAIETTPQGAAALRRLEAALAESRTAHRRDIEARDGEIAGLRARLPSEAILDRLVAERSAVIEAACRVMGQGFDASGKSTAVIRRMAVAKVLGAERVQDRSDDYVTAAFDMLGTDNLPSGLAGHPLAAHLAADRNAADAVRQTALAARDTFLSQAWKGETTGAA